jgi:hypothetical protein
VRFPLRGLRVGPDDVFSWKDSEKDDLEFAQNEKSGFEYPTDAREAFMFSNEKSVYATDSTPREGVYDLFAVF